MPTSSRQDLTNLNGRMRASAPTTKFSNCVVIICNSNEFILQQFTFETKCDIIQENNIGEKIYAFEK